MTSQINRFIGNNYFLSNFSPSPFRLPHWHPAHGLYTPTIEHAFQAAKTEDVAVARLIVTSSSPTMAKRLGRRVTIRPGWDDGRRVIMFALLKLKFAPGTPLANALLDTEDAFLVEGNDWGDTYWGVDAVTGEGANHLGYLLMRVREQLDNRETAGQYTERVRHRSEVDVAAMGGVD